MLLSKASFVDNKMSPFIVKKEAVKTKDGSYSLYLFSRIVMTKEGKKYRFLPLRYEKQLALFKTKKDAEEYGRYRLGLSPEPTKYGTLDKTNTG